MARNFQHELAVEKANHPERGAERAARNRARRKLANALGAGAVAGKDVHHANGKTGDNRLANLKAVKPAAHNHGRKGAMAGCLKK